MVDSSSHSFIRSFARSLIHSSIHPSIHGKTLITYSIKVPFSQKSPLLCRSLNDTREICTALASFRSPEDFRLAVLACNTNRRRRHATPRRRPLKPVENFSRRLVHPSSLGSNVSGSFVDGIRNEGFEKQVAPTVISRILVSFSVSLRIQSRDQSQQQNKHFWEEVDRHQ